MRVVVRDNNSIGSMKKSKLLVGVMGAVLTIGVGAADNKVLFQNGAKLEFYDPMPENGYFGRGWGKAIFQTAQGEAIQLFAMEKIDASGGLLFSGSEDIRISPSGRYAQISIVRAYVGFDEWQEPLGTDRQYCPVIDTESGCIKSNWSGAICGGNWDAKRDVWRAGDAKAIEDDTAAMIQSMGINAEGLWKEYSRSVASGQRSKIVDILRDFFGIQNVVACDGLGKENVSTYRSIAKQIKMEGDRESAEFLQRRIGQMANP